MKGSNRMRQAGVLLVAALAATMLPPSGSTSTADERSGALDQARALASSIEPEQEGQHSWQDRLCAQDPADDTFWLRRTEDGGQERVYEPFPPADILSFCGDYGASLSLEAVLAEGRDPATDPAWGGETGAFWFLDGTGDGDFEHVAVYERDDGGDLVVEVLHLRDDGDEELVCIGTPGYDSGRGALTASGIPGDCLGDPDRVLVAPIMAYDADPDDPQAVILFDVAAHSVGVGRTGRPVARDTGRLAGDTRFTTAVAISRARYPSPADAAGGVYLARADVFADALSAGALSSNPATDGPILLVPSCSAVPEPVLAEIARLDPQTVTALGGQEAVCDDTLEEAAGAGDVQRTIRRLESAQEPTRFGTAVAISGEAFSGGADVAYVATGLQFPDALSAGALDDGPVLLVPSCSEVPEVVQAELSRLGTERVVALGGPAAVCDVVLEEVRTAGGGDRVVRRLAGSTRFETGVAVSGEAYPDGSGVVFVATGDGFPDALAGAVLTDGPVLLVPPCGELPGVVGDELRRLGPDEVIALGGRAAVCDQMLRHAGNA